MCNCCAISSSKQNCKTGNCFQTSFFVTSRQYQQMHNTYNNPTKSRSCSVHWRLCFGCLARVQLPSTKLCLSYGRAVPTTWARETVRGLGALGHWHTDATTPTVTLSVINRPWAMLCQPSAIWAADSRVKRRNQIEEFYCLMQITRKTLWLQTEAEWIRWFQVYSSIVGVRARKEHTRL